ncbi:MAG: hypothetical protein AAFZ65_07670, partial [Planctomycetota bacterium]
WRQLTSLGIECMVAAPSRIPVLPGDRRKTDRLDLDRFNVGSPALVWVFGSLTPSLTLPLPFGDDRLLGLTLDALFLSTLSNSIFLTTLDGNGSGSTMSFPVGVTPGTTFYTAAVSLSVGATVDFLEITGVEEIVVQ